MNVIETNDSYVICISDLKYREQKELYQKNIKISKTETQTIKVWQPDGFVYGVPVHEEISDDEWRNLFIDKSNVVYVFETADLPAFDLLFQKLLETYNEVEGSFEVCN